MKVSEENFLMPITCAGINFRNPFCVSSGPASKTIEQLLKARECGWAGASIKLTFDPAPYINLKPRYYWDNKNKLFSFTAESRLNFEEGLRLIEQGREKTKDFILLANIAYSGNNGLSGWINMAKKFESAGAHIIELNMCCPNMSFNIEVSSEIKKGEPLSGASLGEDEKAVISIIKAVKKSVSIPVFVKLTPEGGKIGQIAKASLKAGADAVVSVANRLGITPMDIYNPNHSVYHLQQEPSMACLSGPWIKPLALRDVYEIRKIVGRNQIIMGTGGISTYRDIIEMAMAGADLFGICTAILISGFDILENIMKNLKAYLNKMSYKSIEEVRDILVESITPASNLTINEGFAFVDKNICTGCGKCLKPGHCNAIELIDNKAHIDNDKCLGCGICSFICPQQAIEIIQRNSLSEN